MMVACIGIVLIFRDSSGLAAAYGLANTGAMNITTLLYCAMLYFAWKWPWYKVLPLWALFSLFDLPFLGASLIKILDGGWLPMLISLIFITVMTTWKTGRLHLRKCFERMSMPLSAFLHTLREVKIARSPGIGVYMTINQHFTPMPLARTVALIHTVPEKMVLLTIQTASTPYVGADKRLEVDDAHKELGLYRMIAHYGYMEHPNIANITEESKETTVHLPLYDCTFYLGRETILASREKPTMQPWRRELFIALSRNAWNAITFFDIPSSRVVEIGTQLEL
jgi:KUP system potassium uptake protein